MNFRELNASDERGIDVVRNQIKQFARTTPLGDATFKILFLDEADALTTDAQAALRRTMESYAQTCRFILSCNYSSKIIDPIQSRCAIYRFKPLGPDAVKEEICRIAGREGLTITGGAMDAIVYIAQGDMRKAINALQGAAIISTAIDEKMVYAITSTARPDEIEELLHALADGDFDGAESLLAHLLHERGIAPNELDKPVLPGNREAGYGPGAESAADRPPRRNGFPPLRRGKQRHPDGSADRAVCPFLAETR